MDDYRNSPTIKFCADLFPAHRCPSVLKPLDDPTRLLLRCCRWSLGHRSSDVKSSTARISSHLSNRALLCLQPASAVVCLIHTLRFANSKQRMNKISPKPCHKKCRSTNLRVCKSASLQVCSLRLSHTGLGLNAVMRDESPCVIWVWSRNCTDKDNSSHECTINTVSFFSFIFYIPKTCRTKLDFRMSPAETQIEKENK